MNRRNTWIFVLFKGITKVFRRWAKPNIDRINCHSHQKRSQKEREKKGRIFHTIDYPTKLFYNTGRFTKKNRKKDNSKSSYQQKSINESFHIIKSIMTASYKNNRYTLLDLRIKTNYAFKKFKNKMSIEKQITYYYSVRQSKINTLFQKQKVFDYFRL